MLKTIQSDKIIIVGQNVFAFYSVFGGKSLLILMVIKNVYRAVIARAISQLLLIIAKAN